MKSSSQSVFGASGLIVVGVFAVLGALAGWTASGAVETLETLETASLTLDQQIISAVTRN